MSLHYCVLIFNHILARVRWQYCNKSTLAYIYTNRNIVVFFICLFTQLSNFLFASQSIDISALIDGLHFCLLSWGIRRHTVRLLFAFLQLHPSKEKRKEKRKAEQNNERIKRKIERRAEDREKKKEWMESDENKEEKKEG